MSGEGLHIKLLTKEMISEILPLVMQLNKNYIEADIKRYLHDMFEYKNYSCFGLFLENELIGVTSGWTTTKLYSGKQLEIDNVIIDHKHQSKGYGKFMEVEISNWCKARDYKSIELNTYVMNSASHKFYFNQGYSIIGYHMEKEF